MAFNKEIKQKLRYEESLPEGMAWNDMQAGILQGLEGATLVSKSGTTLFTWKVIGFLGFVFTSLLVMSIYFIEDKPSDMESKQFPQVPNSSSIARVENEKSNSLIATKTPTQKIELQANEISSKLKSSSREESSALVQKSQNPIDIEIKELSTKLRSNKVAVGATKLEASEQINTQRGENSPISISTLSSALPLLISNSKTTIPTINSTAKRETQADFARLAIELSAGGNIWTPQYAEDIAESAERTSTEKSLLGYQAALNLKYYITPLFFATTGVQIEKLTSRFEYESERSIDVETRATLVGLRINAISNDTTFIYEERSTALETRSVRHYNQQHLLSVPFTLAYAWQKDKVSLELSAGGLFSIKSQTQGRTLYGSDVIDYDRNNPMHRNNYGVAVLAKAQFNYALTEQFYLGGAISNALWLKNWSTEENVKMQPNVSSFSVVLGRKF